MVENLKKSFTSAFDKRMKSPLYGTIIISWLVWNWKAFYYLLTVPGNIDFDARMLKLSYLTNVWTLIVGPLASTAFLLTLVELLSNYVYQSSLYFKKKRIELKQRYEGKELLNIEQSFALKEDLRNANEAAAKLAHERDQMIINLNGTIKENEQKSSKLLNDTHQKYIDTVMLHNDHINLILGKQMADFMELANDIQNNDIVRSEVGTIAKFSKMQLVTSTGRIIL